ncbi:chemotaxis protein CheW [Paenibacillus hexagrammi]|uniref:Chemotaxis protein CheW n=1 Tax=Paenibacillus hexagrammi TaxID=2908839 RepID=A0ABY3SDU7_9BACL|nr:chemotaxis protein CheW [Paenibacillus sp. YPD9-1]UJF31366.1 chemotaxis protein CheW [Paenibacillus sp. YPD9-1]
MQDQYVEFVVNQVTYAMTIHHIHEIIRVREMTHIPNHKPFVKGVINLRGQVLPVVGLRERMGLDRGETTSLSRILILDVQGEMFGAIVDQVNRVTELPSIVPPPEYAVQESHDLIAGIAQEKNVLIHILQAERIFVETNSR